MFWITGIITLFVTTFLMYLLILRNHKEFFIHYILMNILFLFVSGYLCYKCGNLKSNFNEIKNYRMISATYQEMWTTKESYTTEEGIGKNKRTVTHYYTLKHGPYWNAYDDIGNSFQITESDYRQYESLWGQQERIGTNYGSSYSDSSPVTGAIYKITWDNKFDTVFPIEIIDSYQNKVRVTNSVFKSYPTKEEKEKYPRPADLNYTLPVFSYDGTYISNDQVMSLRRVNALLGNYKQVHIILVLFNCNVKQNVVRDVLKAWQGTNMNELVIFAGLKENDIIWAEVASWMDNTELHSILQNKLFEMKKMDGHELSKILLDLVPKHWNRKDFKKDFEYLNVDIHYIWYVAFLFASFLANAFLYIMYTQMRFCI